MSFKVSTKNFISPVAIGGVGGSGTRLFARILIELGFYIGDDLNDAYDNLWYTLLFKRFEILEESEERFGELVNIFLNGMLGNKNFSIHQKKLIKEFASKDRPQHTSVWLKKRVETLLDRNSNIKNQHVNWGWKEPNTHIVIDRLIKHIPGLKYIHVVRNGLDMAHSSNQNQLKLWGAYFMDGNCEITPYNSLKYWRVVHERVIGLTQPLGHRFLLINYEQFCRDPDDSLKYLCKFLEVDVDDEARKVISGLVKPPRTIDRYKEIGLCMFDKEDIEFARRLGFEITDGNSIS